MFSSPKNAVHMAVGVGPWHSLRLVRGALGWALGPASICLYCPLTLPTRFPYKGLTLTPLQNLCLCEDPHHPHLSCQGRMATVQGFAGGVRWGHIQQESDVQGCCLAWGLRGSDLRRLQQLWDHRSKSRTSHTQFPDLLHLPALGHPGPSLLKGFDSTSGFSPALSISHGVCCPPGPGGSARMWHLWLLLLVRGSKGLFVATCDFTNEPHCHAYPVRLAGT